MIWIRRICRSRMGLGFRFVLPFLRFHPFIHPTFLCIRYMYYLEHELTVVFSFILLDGDAVLVLMSDVDMDVYIYRSARPTRYS